MKSLQNKGFCVCIRPMRFDAVWGLPDINGGHNWGLVIGIRKKGPQWH